VTENTTTKRIVRKLFLFIPVPFPTSNEFDLRILSPPAQSLGDLYNKNRHTIFFRASFLGLKFP
jgi:hypothetical protein